HYTLLLFPLTPTSCIHTLSLHDALPISFIEVSSKRGIASQLTVSVSPSIMPMSRGSKAKKNGASRSSNRTTCCAETSLPQSSARSEEHTSELQSRENLVCRLLLEKKKKQ